MLADLDELLLKCRNASSKKYLAESIASYKAGAYRASIVSAWIATCFDVIEKLRELALTGDAMALQQVASLEAARRSENIKAFLDFEQKMLELARDKFELLSPIEYSELSRLKQDRNYCAHPSLISDTDPFEPSAELARFHIRSVVTHLLQHPPVQGKAALGRALSDVDSEYFPEDRSKALVILAAGPLQRPKQSLLRGFISVIFKNILAGGLAYKRKRQYAAAIHSLRTLHPDWSTEVLRDVTPKFLRNVKDEELENCLTLFEYVDDLWAFLPADIQHRMNGYVESLPTEHFDRIEFCLGFAPLRESALARAKAMSIKDIGGALFFILPPELGKVLVTRVLYSREAKYAIAWIKVLHGYAFDLELAPILELIHKARSREVICNLQELLELFLHFSKSTQYGKEIISELEKAGWNELSLFF